VDSRVPAASGMGGYPFFSQILFLNCARLYFERYRRLSQGCVSDFVKVVVFFFFFLHHQSSLRLALLTCCGISNSPHVLPFCSFHLNFFLDFQS